MTRTDIINALIEKYDLKSYLEIGVREGENIKAVKCGIKHSVDPNFKATYNMTSNAFFKTKIYRYYDLIFVDGLHTEEQVYLDIVNSLGYLEKNGFVVVHDCNPATEWHTRSVEEYNRDGGEWNGTSYKAFIRIKAKLKDFTCFVVDADYGCGIITQRPMLENKISGYWEYFNTHRKELLQLKSVAGFEKLLK